MASGQKRDVIVYNLLADEEAVFARETEWMKMIPYTGSNAQGEKMVDKVDWWMAKVKFEVGPKTAYDRSKPNAKEKFKKAQLLQDAIVDYLTELDQNLKNQRDLPRLQDYLVKNPDMVKDLETVVNDVRTGEIALTDLR